MLKTETRRIGPALYYVRQLGALEGQGVLVRLFKILGAALPELVQAKAGGEAGSLSTAALATLASKIEEEDLDYFVRKFAPCTNVHVTEGALKTAGPAPLDDTRRDALFAGAYGDMFRWLKFCLEVNFGNFSVGLTGAAPSTPPAMTPTPSPNT